MQFLQDVCNRYNTLRNRAIHKRFRSQYRQALKNQRILSKDKLIETAKNPIRSILNVINCEQGTYKSDNVKIGPNEFSEFLSSIAGNLT